MIILDKISASIGSLQVLQNVSCSVHKGDFVMIIGPNGTGKSTLFDIISGRRMSNHGKLLIDGIDVTKKSESGRALLVARLFQNPQLGSVGSMSVKENLALAMLKSKKISLKNGLDNFPKKILTKIQTVLGYDINDLLERPMGQLSGGQRQLIALIMAVLVPPRVLLLDEPTSALDPVAATALLKCVRTIALEMGITTLMITHDLMLAQQLGNKLWVMRQGGIETQFGAEKRLLDINTVVTGIDYSWL